MCPCNVTKPWVFLLRQMCSDSNEQTASDASSASMLEEVSQFLVIHL